MSKGCIGSIHVPRHQWCLVEECQAVVSDDCSGSSMGHVSRRNSLRSLSLNISQIRSMLSLNSWKGRVCRWQNTSTNSLDSWFAEDPVDTEEKKAKSFYKGLRLGLFKDVTLVTKPVTVKEAITGAYWAEDMNKSIVESREANKKKW